jgi:heme/copper-type cytochrome/quinol oxidase subunit 3
MSDPRPVAWWGMVLTVMVLATLYAAMCFTYIYIRVTSLQWPPEGTPAPEPWAAGLSAAALSASGAAVWFARRAPVPGLAAALALAGGHAWLLVDDWAQPGFDPTAHAYGSASVVLPAVHLSFVAVGMVIAAVLLGLALRAPGQRLDVGMRSLALYWYATVAGGLLLLALVYGTPHLWSDPWPVP